MFHKQKELIIMPTIKMKLSIKIKRVFSTETCLVETKVTTTLALAGPFSFNSVFVSRIFHHANTYKLLIDLIHLSAGCSFHEQTVGHVYLRRL